MLCIAWPAQTMAGGETFGDLAMGAQKGRTTPPYEEIEHRVWKQERGPGRRIT